MMCVCVWGGGGVQYDVCVGGGFSMMCGGFSMMCVWGGSV